MVFGIQSTYIKMKKLSNGDLFTRGEFRECVKKGWFVDTDGFGRYSNETGLRVYLLPLSWKMKNVIKILNIHMQYGLINNN